MVLKELQFRTSEIVKVDVENNLYRKSRGAIPGA